LRNPSLIYGVSLQEKCTFIPDPNKLGYKVHAFVVLEIELGCLDSVIKSVTCQANADFMALCACQVDILIEAWFKSSKEMVNFAKGYPAKSPAS